MKTTITERGFVKAFCPGFYKNQMKNAKKRKSHGTIFQTLNIHEAHK
jgi:hypothetical protein